MGVHLRCLQGECLVYVWLDYDWRWWYERDRNRHGAVRYVWPLNRERDDEPFSWCRAVHDHLSFHIDFPRSRRVVLLLGKQLPNQVKCLALQLCEATDRHL